MFTCPLVEQAKKIPSSGSANVVAATASTAPTDEPGATLCVDLKPDMNPDRVGHKHMLTIVDHAINYNRVYLLRKKSDAEEILEGFISELECQFDTKVKVVRSAGGGAFGSTRLDRFLRNRGIRHQLTEQDMSASNGKAERFHRTVMDSARAMLWASVIPKRFWGDAVLYASYIRNYLPTRANADHASPIEALTGKVPDVSHILRFGAKCTNHITHATKKSAKKRAEKGVIIGIDSQKKAYHVFIPRTKCIIATTHIQNIDRLDPRARSDDEEDLQQGTPAELHNFNSRAIQHIFGLNRGARALPQDDFQLPQCFLDEFVTPSTLLITIGLEGGTAFTILLDTANITTPATVAEAMKSPHWHKWVRAMQEELKAIAGNATWEIVEIPRDGNLISAKWVFKIKFDS
ncbi:unnamed protein product [Phytophthora fragariaefolia]|uniref:Unnamed protein product n=1 Tax=Phytophthora fragariaefolia TaxID=1490495 RepID=A0A9W7DC65_9STRA|nr:unnamed protein product [Phytophthora fragariaefolia]